MTPKEYLNQAYWLDRRIDSKLEQLSALKDMATKTTSAMTDDVVSHTRNVHSMQDVIAKIIDMQAEINADIDRLVDLKSEIKDSMDSKEIKEYLLKRLSGFVLNNLGHEYLPAINVQLEKMKEISPS